MQSHYYLMWRLWAAVFRPWPGSPLLRQPGYHRLPHGHHIDIKLSVDILSTWRFMMKSPQPHVIHIIQFSSSWVTEARHYLQLITSISKLYQYFQCHTRDKWIQMVLFIHIFCCVLRDSLGHYVGRSIGQSVGRSVDQSVHYMFAFRSVFIRPKVDL